MKNRSTLKHHSRRCLALLLATALWLPCLSRFYYPGAGDFAPTEGLSPQARKMAAWQSGLWSDEALRRREVGAMRAANPEWDLMERSYLVWALANMALRDPASKPACLRRMDQVIADTLAQERQRGLFYFLMPYARARPFVQQPVGSQFLDGEIALMLGVRRVVAEKPEYKRLLLARTRRIVARMEHSPTLSAESYPDECWTFCNVIALDALQVEDYLDGSDHSALLRGWVVMARQKLLDPKTGLLVSAYTLDGHPLYGPEGSSLWMVAHSLQLIDPDFARSQYRAACRETEGSLLGFGYAREWPKSWRGPQDVDSGVVVPGLDISPGATGMAVLGAAAFGDRPRLAALTATLNFAAFPAETGGRRRFCAGNPVGDAVLLYAATLGPIWKKVGMKKVGMKKVGMKKVGAGVRP